MLAIIRVRTVNSGIKQFHVYRRRIDIGTELHCELELQNQHSQNATVVKTIESDEIAGHVPGFLAQVLAPMMQSREIVSIDAVITGEPRNAPEGTWVPGGETQIPWICQIYGCKNKMHNIRTAAGGAAL